MTDSQNYAQYHFLLITYTNIHQTFFPSGCPRHYIARMISGTGIIKTETETLELHPGEFFYIPKGIVYQSMWFPDTLGSVSLYSFGCDTLPFGTAEQYLLQKFHCNESSRIIFEQLIQDIAVDFRSIGYLMLFFSTIQADLKHISHSSGNPIMAIALQYMNEHNSYSVKDVARFCGVSESGLYYLFRRHLKRSPVSVKNEILAAKATELLTGTDLSIEQIADRLSFGSASYFRRVLFKHTGKTPTQIRKEARM